MLKRMAIFNTVDRQIEDHHYSVFSTFHSSYYYYASSFTVELLNYNIKQISLLRNCVCILYFPFDTVLYFISKTKPKETIKSPV